MERFHIPLSLLMFQRLIKAPKTPMRAATTETLHGRVILDALDEVASKLAYQQPDGGGEENSVWQRVDFQGRQHGWENERKKRKGVF